MFKKIQNEIREYILMLYNIILVLLVVHELIEV